jgi:undecaprenyl-diphosphatase
MNMIFSYIKTIDTWLFRVVNTGMSNPVFDWLMPVLTTGSNWYAAILVILFLVVIRGKEQGVKTVILIFLVLGISDGMTSHVIKPLVHRLRPFETLANIHQLVNAYGYSFPSSHAANTFSVAVLVHYLYKNKIISIILFTIAFLASFSRVYVGVHYPVDVIAGAMSSVVYVYLAVKFYNIIARVGKPTPTRF